MNCEEFVAFLNGLEVSVTEMKVRTAKLVNVNDEGKWNWNPNSRQC